METSENRNVHGTKSVAFGEDLLKELEKSAEANTNGNLSELCRVLLRNGLDRLNNKQLIIRKAETTTIEVND
tara:strand:+ start:1337 stop:1552 length:216 start_codon:yes stop_codon:yes gene_type:complete